MNNYIPSRKPGEKSRVSPVNLGMVWYPKHRYFLFGLFTVIWYVFIGKTSLSSH